VTISGVYEDCDECLACWELTRCDDPNVTIKSNTDLADLQERVVKLADGNCYFITRAQNCYSATPVTVIEDYPTCVACQGCYTLVGCWDSNATLTITNDLAELTAKSPQDVVADATVVQIDGICYTVTAYDNVCYNAEHVKIDNITTTCEQCGCFILTSCDDDPQTTLAVYAAVDGDGDDLDLSDYLGQVVRLDDGLLYTVSRGTECTGATSVTVLEAYDDCEVAVCYELTDCETSATLITYADLAAYAADTVLKRVEDERCYTFVGEHEWDSNAVAFTVDSEYPNCAACLAQIKYRLVPSCPAISCAGAGSLPEIITTEDLHAAVGQYVQVEGNCYAVEVTETGDVSDATLDYQGPYPDCNSCRSQPVTTQKPRITRVYIDGNSLKADLEYDLIQDGLIVGFCPADPQIIGDYCCDETSSGHPPV
jgi:hypothetical protein